MISFKHLKGIHPGIVVERELEKRKLQKGRFALSLQEHPQTFGTITKGKRSMNTSLALKIEEALGWEEGFLMTLQVFFDIKQEKQNRLNKQQPDLARFRPALFWDTNPEKIDWIQQKRAVIERVSERGNLSEKKELLRFYGKAEVAQVLEGLKKV